MPSTPVIFKKVIGNLPAIIIPDSLYAVRSGDGMDLYVSDMTGAIAYKTNPATSDITLINGASRLIQTQRIMAQMSLRSGI